VNKAEFITAIAERTDLTKKDIEKVVSAYSDVVIDSLKSGDKVQLVGFGTFEVRERSARTAKNPQTGATIQVEASKVPAFRVGKAFKDAVK